MRTRYIFTYILDESDERRKRKDVLHNVLSFFSFFPFMNYDLDAIKFFTIVFYSIIFFRELLSPC